MPPSSHARCPPALSSERGLPTPNNSAWQAGVARQLRRSHGDDEQGMPNRPLAFCLAVRTSKSLPLLLYQLANFRVPLGALRASKLLQRLLMSIYEYWSVATPFWSTWGSLASESRECARAMPVVSVSEEAQPLNVGNMQHLPLPFINSDLDWRQWAS